MLGGQQLSKKDWHEVERLLWSMVASMLIVAAAGIFIHNIESFVINFIIYTGFMPILAGVINTIWATYDKTRS